MKLRRFDEPDKTTLFHLGRVDLVQLGNLTLGRACYEPGWRWSTHVGTATGERWCQTAHVGIVLSGRNRVEMQDGRAVEMGPGDIFDIGPGHDSLVIGDEPYESLHLVGAEHYVRSSGAGAED
ncbi:MAG: cupin domain-containing protein [Chloroflexota bacterium]